MGDIKMKIISCVFLADNKIAKDDNKLGKKEQTYRLIEI